MLMRRGMHRGSRTDGAFPSVLVGREVKTQVFADMLDLVWEDSSKSSASGSITFTDLVNMVLNMRGSNPATVKAGGSGRFVYVTVPDVSTLSWAYVSLNRSPMSPQPLTLSDFGGCQLLPTGLQRTDPCNKLFHEALLHRAVR